MSHLLEAELKFQEGELARFRKLFEEDGTITPDEKSRLDAQTAKINRIKENLAKEKNAGPAIWNVPFDDLDCERKVDNTGDATTALVDIQRSLSEWKAAGYDKEIDLCNAAIKKDLDAFSGVSRPLKQDEATRLTAWGLMAFQTRKNANDEMSKLISAELDKFKMDAQANLDEANELLHQQFMKDDSSNTISDLKDMISKAKDMAGKISDYIGYAGKAKDMIKAAAKLEDLKKGVDFLKGKLSTATEICGLANDVATLAGKVSKKPGGTAQDINQLNAGFGVVDFIISKSSVPLIGDYWTKVIKPQADMAMKALQKLADLANSFAREQAQRWWEECAMKSLRSPVLTESGLQANQINENFPGGQHMMDFMWSLFRGNPPDSVPADVEKHMATYRKRFNAGLPEAEQLQSDDHWYNLWNAVTDEKLPNLKAWVTKNKETVWGMQYGSFRHP